MAKAHIVMKATSILEKRKSSSFALKSKWLDMNSLGAHVKEIAVVFHHHLELPHHLINSHHCRSKGEFDHLGNFVRVCPQIAHHEVILLAGNEKENTTFMFYHHNLNIHCSKWNLSSLWVRCGPDNVSFNMNCGDETIGGDIINVNRGLKNIVVNIKSDIFKENFFHRSLTSLTLWM